SPWRSITGTYPCSARTWGRRAGRPRNPRLDPPAEEAAGEASLGGLGRGGFPLPVALPTGPTTGSAALPRGQRGLGGPEVIIIDPRRGLPADWKARQFSPLPPEDFALPTGGVGRGGIPAPFSCNLGARISI